MSENLYKDDKSEAAKGEAMGSAPHKTDEKPQPDPRLAEGVRLAHELFDAKKFDECESELLNVLELDSEHLHAKYCLALVYRDLERLQESEKLLLELDGRLPHHQASIDINLGVLAERYGKGDNAVALYRKAIEREFQNAQAHLNLAFALLRMGQYEEGWKEHEWRWQTEHFHPVRCLQPRWNGETLDGTVMVHTEQGSGDTFQFMRFMPLIRERCKEVLLLVPNHLKCTFHGTQWADEILPVGNVPLERFQAILPLMSAPYALGIGSNDHSPMVPYLTPQPRDVELGESHVEGAQLKVGIAWGGSVTHSNNAYRSCSLKQMSSLFEIPKIAFYSIQKGPQVKEIAELGDSRLKDTAPLQNDFADAAAIMKQMDLIISVDTSILHLAGGMGLPVWGLLGARVDWRWGIDRADSDWYPTLTLYRQKSQLPGELNWDELFQRVSRDLRKIVDAS